MAYRETELGQLLTSESVRERNRGASQLRLLVAEHGSFGAVARHLGVNWRTVVRWADLAAVDSPARAHKKRTA